MMTETCFKCSSIIDESEKRFIKCYASCKRAYHLKCVNLKTEHLNALVNIRNLQWYCDDCVNTTKHATAGEIASNISNVFKEALEPLVTHVSKLVENIPNIINAQITNQQPRRNIIESENISRKRRRPEDDNLIVKSKPRYDMSLNYGTNSSSTKLKGIPPPIPKANMRQLFVSRLHPSTTVDDIINYLLESKIIKEGNEVQCTKLVALNRNIEELVFVSFKLSVTDDLFTIVNDPKIWPQTVAIREFVNRPRQNVEVAILPCSITQSKSFSNEEPIIESIQMDDFLTDQSDEAILEGSPSIGAALETIRRVEKSRTVKNKKDTGKNAKN